MSARSARRARTGCGAGLLGVLTLAIAACGGNPATGVDGPARGGSAQTVDLGPAFAERVSAARSVRRACGDESFAPAGPVRWNARLAVAALDQSRHLARTGRLSHTGRGGSSLGERVRRSGYQPRAWGENVASGQRDAGAVLDAWLRSPGHCRNIMNPDYSEIGAAAVRAADGRLYWTMVLAAPRQ